jgi:hypothetical protein
MRTNWYRMSSIGRGNKLAIEERQGRTREPAIRGANAQEDRDDA